MIKLAKELDKVFIIVRYKYIDWLNNDYFEIKNKIKVTKNIIISQNYAYFKWLIVYVQIRSDYSKTY